MTSETNSRSGEGKAGPANAGDDWHAIPEDAVLDRTRSTREGLDRAEAARRLEEHGPNELPRGTPPTLAAILYRQFKSPLIYILLLAAVVALAYGDYTDAGFIGIVLLVNALIGGGQEWKAEKSSRALQQLLQVRASVLREGQTREIPADQVVPGDLLLFESGDRVPADVRLLSGYALEIDESLLTGESLAVSKDYRATCAPDAPVGDRENMAFAGSIVIRGRGMGVVVATGAKTMVGQLAVDVIGSEGARPPLMERMERFSRTIAMAVLVAAVGIGVLGIIVHGYEVGEMVMFGIAIAVAAIPEGLPITITVALAIATTRMARRGVIVRRLAAVEGLGSCTMIASDKTGTLTVNELTVREIRLAGGAVLEVTGQGFVPEGEIRQDGSPIDLSFIAEEREDAERSGSKRTEQLGDLSRLIRVSLLCNEGSLHHQDGGWKWRGDPTDVALLSLGLKAKSNRESMLAEVPRVNEIPFEPEHQYAASHHRVGDEIEVFVKGAPERVLGMCEFDDPGSLESHLACAREMADSGYRVLAMASGPAASDLAVIENPPEPSGLRFAGLVGMIDPLREGVRDAIAACRQAGIRVCMVTGDHPVTASAIARDLGMAERGRQVVQGHEVAALSGEELRHLVERTRVFARVAPRQKLEIVKASRDSGHFVAVTGDGVNDAPALRAANIGVAMGKSGTDVARESAELIVSDDNFATIVAGVEEGRVAYDNIRKVIFLLISTGAAEVSLLGLAILTGMPLPLLPVQILWLNLVTSGLQDKPLALEAAEGDVLRRPPRSPQESIFNPLMIERTLVVALTMAAVGYSAFVWMLDQGWSEESARNGLLLFIVLMKTFHLGAARSETRYTFLMPPWKNPLLLACGAGAVVVQLVAMHLAPLQSILGTEPVSFGTFMFLAFAATSIFFVLEIHKWTWRLRHPPTDL